MSDDRRLQRDGAAAGADDQRSDAAATLGTNPGADLSIIRRRGTAIYARHRATTVSVRPEGQS